MSKGKVSFASSKAYWDKRQSELIKSADIADEKVYKKLQAFYKIEGAKLDRMIARYYQQFGVDNVLKYRELTKTLSDADRTLLMQDLDKFIDKFPEHDDIKAIRSTVYKLDRLEGLKASVLMQQYEMANKEVDVLREHFEGIYRKGQQTSVDYMNKLGFGNNFNAENTEVARQFINSRWVNGESFRLYANRKKIAEYLSNEFIQATVRGATYKKISEHMQNKLTGLSASQTKRIIRTESTYVLNEASISSFERANMFEEYEYNAIIDERTTVVCKGLSGQKFLIKDRKPGTNFPPMHPWCRSTYSVVIPKDWMDKAVEKYREESREIVNDKIFDVKINKIDETDKKAVKSEINRLSNELKRLDDLAEKKGDSFSKEKWGEIEKAYTKAEKELNKLKGIVFDKISDFTGTLPTKFNPASTIEEANKYAEKHFGIRCSYKGIDIRAANEWNEGVYNMIKEYPEVAKNIKFIGTTQERNRLLKGEVRQYVIDSFFPDVENISKFKKQIDEKTDEYCKKLGIKNISSKTLASSRTKIDKFVLIPDKLIEMHNNYVGITINKNNMKNYENLLEIQSLDVKSKFAPNGCNTVKSIFDHEFGHQLDDYYGIGKMDEVVKLRKSMSNEELTEALSTYSWKNSNPDICSEMIAEAWAEYQNSDSPREVAKFIGKIIEEAKKNGK